jgi:hypothetical protein
VTKLKFPFIAAGMLVPLVALAVSPARSGLLSLVSSSGAEQTTFRIAGDAVGSVYPGGSSVPIDLAVTNTGSSAITVTSVAVKIAGASNAGCDTSNFSIASQLAASVSVPAGSTVSLSQAGVPSTQWPQIAMLDTAANQDACRGAAIDLAYTGTATRAGSPVAPPPALSASVSHGIVYVNGQRYRNGTIPYGATVLIKPAGSLSLRGYGGAITVKPPPGRSIQFTIARAFVTLPYRASIASAKPRSQAYVELFMTGGDFSRCGAAKRGRAHPLVVRSMSQTARGRFRVAGLYARATVKNASWLVQDRCDGTRVTTYSGSVRVYDAVKKMVVFVKAGHSYMAHAPSGASVKAGAGHA